MIARFAVLALLAACASTQAAAAKDPMKCERDPKCTEKTRANDCSTQCSDDSACVERCEQIQKESGAARVGH